MRDYPPQLLAMVINNISFATEIDGLLKRLDEDLGEALERHLENLTAERPGWQGKFKLSADDDEDIYWASNEKIYWAGDDWPKNGAGEPLAYYCLDGGLAGHILQNEAGKPSPFYCLDLSYRGNWGAYKRLIYVALGNAGHELRFFFNYEQNYFIDYKSLKNKLKLAALRKPYNEKKKAILRELYDRQTLLRETGFYLDETSGLIYRPFVLSSESLAENYPDFEPVFQPLNEAWKDLLKVHHVFDEFVKTNMDLEPGIDVKADDKSFNEAPGIVKSKERPKKGGGLGGHGVIATICEVIDGKKGQKFTLKEIHNVLVKRFPDRDPDGMFVTVKSQVPRRLERNKGYTFKKYADGSFTIVSMAASHDGTESENEEESEDNGFDDVLPPESAEGHESE